MKREAALLLASLSLTAASSTMESGEVEYRYTG